MNAGRVIRIWLKYLFAQTESEIKRASERFALSLKGREGICFVREHSLTQQTDAKLRREPTRSSRLHVYMCAAEKMLIESVRLFDSVCDAAASLSLWCDGKAVAMDVNLN